MAPEGAANKRGLEQGSFRYRLVAGAKDERFKTFVERAGRRDVNKRKRSRLRSTFNASLFMSTETGTEAHCIFDNTPGESGLEAWRRFVQRRRI